MESEATNRVEVKHASTLRFLQGIVKRVIANSLTEQDGHKTFQISGFWVDYGYLEMMVLTSGFKLTRYQISAV